MESLGSLPPLHARWVDTLIGAPIPEETVATCGNCAMVTGESSTDPGFNPATKCCTFLPKLWNFLAGGMLLDDGVDATRGRATVRARVDSGIGVTPLGLMQFADYRQRYGDESFAFGTNESLLCPHYVGSGGGQCSIWRHRESTCATWFCKHRRGAVGLAFWSRLRQLLHAIEETLATWSLRELGVESQFGGHWGRWQGQEVELYKACARAVAPLAWEDVVRIGGARLSSLGQDVSQAFDVLSSDAIPERPTFALVQITPRGTRRARLGTYSGLDELEVSSVVAAILPYFDGRPTADALAEIHRSEGVRVDPSLVRKLTDFGVLRE